MMAESTAEHFNGDSAGKRGQVEFYWLEPSRRLATIRIVSLLRRTNARFFQLGESALTRRRQRLRPRRRHESANGLEE